MALPVLSRAYSARRDCLFPLRDTGVNLARSNVWSLKAHLMDQIATGTAGPTARAGASVWTCIGSSDSVAAGLDAVDRWTGTFDSTKIVFAANTVAHSWIVLQCTALGVQLCIDCQNTSPNILIAMTPIASPFTGGSTTTRPIVGTHEVNAGYTTSHVANFISNWYVDTTLASNQRSQFVNAADGSFLYFATRDGLGFATTFFAVQNPLGNSWFPKRVADTNAQFPWIATGSISSPGALVLSGLTAPGQSPTRLPNGNLITQGGLSTFSFGNTAFVNASLPADAFTLEYPAVPLGYLAMAGQQLPRGVVPDVYVHANRALIPTGTVNDPGSVVSHLAVGDLWLPWDGAAPTF